jgi:hypothetical protein
VHVELTIGGKEVVAEDALAEFIAGDDLTGRFGECGHQLEFEGGQGDSAAVVTNEAGARVNFEIAEDGAIGRRRGGVCGGDSSAAEHGVDARGEFAGIKGLGEVIIGADFQADDAVHIVAVSGEHDNGDSGYGADFAENFEAAHAGKHYVENDEGIGSGESAAETDAAVVNSFGAQALGDEVFGDEFAQLDVVINDENAGGERWCCMVRGHREHRRTCHRGDGAEPGEGTRLTILVDFSGGATGSRAAGRGCDAMGCESAYE